MYVAGYFSRRLGEGRGEAKIVWLRKKGFRFSSFILFSKPYRDPTPSSLLSCAHDNNTPEGVGKLKGPPCKGLPGPIRVIFQGLPGPFRVIFQGLPGPISTTIQGLPGPISTTIQGLPGPIRVIFQGLPGPISTTIQGSPGPIRAIFHGLLETYFWA